MTVEQALRRIERMCRDDARRLKGYAPRWRGDKGAIMKGAQAEARGMVDQCEEVRRLCRKLRREHRIEDAK